MLKSTGSEFKGFLRDEYTTLPDADDRILATALRAEWRHRDGARPDWNTTYDAVRALLLATFATTYSHALQETLYAMGRSVLEAHDEIDLISFTAPNKHHFLVDLEPFGLDNPGEVFIAADRPYGLIEATVRRDGVTGAVAPTGLGAFNARSDDDARSTAAHLPRRAAVGRPGAGGPAVRHARRGRGGDGRRFCDDLRRGAGAGAGAAPADRRARRRGQARRRPLHARAVRRRPGRRRPGPSPRGGQPGLRGALRPGVHRPGRGPQRCRHPRAPAAAPGQQRRARARRDDRPADPDRGPADEGAREVAS